MGELYWSGSDFNFWCFIDKKRTLHLKKVISDLVNPGDIVVDVGTGTGILAIFAAEAGAKKVYAIESDQNLWKTLETNFRSNGYAERIKFIKGDARDIKLPEKADVIICEMIATGLIDEIQIPVLNNILKYSKNRNHIVPYTLRNYIDLVYNNNKFYNHILHIIRYEYSWHPELKSLSYTQKHLYREIDFRIINKDMVDAKLDLKIERSGKINGLRISNETVFPDGSTLGDSEAYCIPLILPIKEQQVQKGDTYTLRLSYNMCKGLKTIDYTLEKS